MKLLIDGYNVMHAAGLMPPKMGPDAFRRVRTRFLNDLADALEPFELPFATVVFDASKPPDHLPSRQKHKGITVIFATGDDDADARIETILAKNGSARSLTVVSSDRQIIRAAAKRKATPMTADAFLVEMAERRRKKKATRKAPEVVKETPSKAVSASEAAYWAREFADVDDEARELSAQSGAAGPMLTDDDLARIEAEIDREMKGLGTRRI